MTARRSIHSSLSDPAAKAAEVTPNDDVDLTFATTALWIGTGGTLKVTMLSGAVVTFPGVPDGVWMPLQVDRVWDTGTSASGIVAVHSAD